MSKIIIRGLSIVALVFSSLVGSAFAAGNGTIEGYVKDASTGEPLPGANVLIEGTSIGTSSDINGRFVISNVPPGSYTLRAAYIGYKVYETHMRVVSGASITVNLTLQPVGVEGKEVVVTAQASGQNAAINQQLASNQIISVVSAAKIMELPDANAAESVGRLPGVSVLRSGGEAYAVVIRGMQPKYNSVTIDGISMGSSSPDTRFTDLSMVSSNMLEGIEVSKTASADMDANAIGGTVNFDMREAQVKEPGVPEFGLIVQGGYNGLSDAQNKYNNYKYVGTVQDRLLDDRFGVFAQVDVERKNLTSNEMGASYGSYGNSVTQYLVSSINLHDIPRDRQRYNAALVMDYKIPDGKIKLTNFASTGTTNTVNYSESFDLGYNIRLYGVAGSRGTLSNVLDALDYQQQLVGFEVDMKLSHSFSDNKTPNNWNVNFQQTSAGLNPYINVTGVNPIDVVKNANNDYSAASLYQFNTTNSYNRQDALTASLDLKKTLNFSDNVNADIKFGGKFQHMNRAYNTDVINGTLIGSYVTSVIAPYFNLTPDQAQYMTNWIDPSFSYGKFLNGDYTMIAPLSLAKFSQLGGYLNDNVQALNPSWYGYNQTSSITNDYHGYENTSAVYVMTVVNIGQQISFIPGVRYQNLQTTYTAPQGYENAQSYNAYNHYDTTVTQAHGYWLPDISLRYRPLSWFDVRLSYTNTVTYPDYSTITPRIDVGVGGGISWNNPTLVPGRSANYDASFSFYNDGIGLITVNPFLKQIRNLIYAWAFYPPDSASIVQYMPHHLPGSTSINPSQAYKVSTYFNNPYLINDYGIELEWQTHFWYLPWSLSGLVLSVNYTHIFSKAQYPDQYTYQASRFSPPQFVNTPFVDRLIDQPDNIFNITVGYDYKGFSVRVAMLYTSDIFTAANIDPALAAHTSAYKRWDLSAKQALPWFGLQAYADINNITGASDISVIAGGGVPTSYQDYGMTADIGLKWGL